MTKENVFVTGGAGYVGSILVQKLINNGYDTRVLDSMWFGSQGLNSIKNKCEIIKGDIRDSKLVEKCLNNTDYVIHLAAISNDPCSDLNPELTTQVNYTATKDLVKLAKQKGVKRFIYASTGSVYGIKEEENVTEDLSLEPLTIYAKTKALSEEFVRKNNDDNFTTVSLRPATVCGYSPRLRLDLTVNMLTEHAINRGKIIVFGGEQQRPNIYIQDIIDYYTGLLTAPKEKIGGEIFNVGYENHTIMNIAKIIKENIGNHVKIETTKSDDNRSYRLCSEKIERILGFYPNKTIKDGISDIKCAFEQGLIRNPSDSIYKNIVRMREMILNGELKW